MCAIRTCPQAALCVAFDQLLKEIQRDEVIALRTPWLPPRINLLLINPALDRALVKCVS